MRRNGWSYRRIARALDMSFNGVMMALRRVLEPDRYYQRLEEEVGNVGARPEEW
jgi:DNA-directed RNA polymerase specialized sigma24 family protein